MPAVVVVAVAEPVAWRRATAISQASSRYMCAPSATLLMVWLTPASSRLLEAAAGTDGQQQHGNRREGLAQGVANIGAWHAGGPAQANDGGDDRQARAISGSPRNFKVKPGVLSASSDCFRCCRASESPAAK